MHKAALNSRCEKYTKEQAPAAKDDAPAQLAAAKQLETLAVLAHKQNLSDGEATKLKAEIDKNTQKQKDRIDRIKKLEKKAEQGEDDPDQLELNMQLALTRLVQSPAEQQQARTDGVKFQRKYNLTNEQMWTLCRIALDAGVLKETPDLTTLLSEIDELDPVTLALSPDALERLYPGDTNKQREHLVGSCSSCCP